MTLMLAPAARTTFNEPWCIHIFICNICIYIFGIATYCSNSVLSIVLPIELRIEVPIVLPIVLPIELPIGLRLYCFLLCVSDLRQLQAELELWSSASSRARARLSLEPAVPARATRAASGTSGMPSDSKRNE